MIKEYSLRAFAELCDLCQDAANDAAGCQEEDAVLRLAQDFERLNKGEPPRDPASKTFYDELRARKQTKSYCFLQAPEVTVYLHTLQPFDANSKLRWKWYVLIGLLARMDTKEQRIDRICFDEVHQTLSIDGLEYSNAPMNRWIARAIAAYEKPPAGIKNQIVGSNNLLRGLLPADGLFDRIDLYKTKKEKNLLRWSEKRINVRFYIRCDQGYQLFAEKTDCTIGSDENGKKSSGPFVIMGATGSLWFRYNFPLSYIGLQEAISGHRESKKTNLFIVSDRERKRLFSMYQNGRLEGDINPLESFRIYRISKYGEERLELYPEYQFLQKQWPALPEKYRKMIQTYYENNRAIGFADVGEQADRPVKCEGSWIGAEKKLDIQTTGGWYILRLPRQREFYFGKAVTMCTRITWQLSEGQRLIGHPEHGEPLFEDYAAWYLDRETLKQRYAAVSREERNAKLFELAWEIIECIVPFVADAMGARVDCVGTAPSQALSEQQEFSSDFFFNSYLSMISRNAPVDKCKKAKRATHYVFNCFCTPWRSGNAAPEQIGVAAGIYMTKQADKTYAMGHSFDLRQTLSGVTERNRYLCVDLSKMLTDIQNRKPERNIYEGFLYGVEGLINDLLWFLADDLGDVIFRNDAFDAATNAGKTLK